jgi:curved DNA-binding protein
MPVEFKDYYKILGVPRTAPDDEIRKVFRKLARQYHPDVAKDKKNAEEKFKEINEAYEVLGDPAKRKKYDTLGANWNRQTSAPPPGWQSRGGSRRGASPEEYEFHFGGTGFSDFFEQFFSGASHRFDGHHPDDDEGRPRARVQRGRDIEGDILVTLDEVLHGSVRSITLRKVNPQTGAEETHTYRVKIPHGVQEGQLVRLAGKGEAGFGGGESGDLFLRVKLAQHPNLRVRETDLYYDLDLAPWEAVLGATVSVPTLDGPVSLKVPPGTTSGQQLRLRGKGLPVGQERGDFYAVVEVQTPVQISAEERGLWEQLQNKSRFNPRKT